MAWPFSFKRPPLRKCHTNRWNFELSEHFPLVHGVHLRRVFLSANKFPPCAYATHGTAASASLMVLYSSGLNFHSGPFCFISLSSRARLVPSLVQADIVLDKLDGRMTSTGTITTALHNNITWLHGWNNAS